MSERLRERKCTHFSRGQTEMFLKQLTTESAISKMHAMQ